MSNTITNATLILGLLSGLLGQTFPQHASAAPVFYVSNPTGNSADWSNAVAGWGGAINDNVDFELHPLGALQNNFYSASDGAGFTPSGAIGSVVSGPGPGQANTGNPYRGEGVHPSSKYLRAGEGGSELTLSFDDNVLGAGLFTVDLFSSQVLTLAAFDGPAGAGNLLGDVSFTAPANFQQNGLFFLGVTDAANVIRSVRFTHSGTLADEIGIDDIRFATVVPEPATATLVALGLVGIGLYWRKRTAGC